LIDWVLKVMMRGMPFIRNIQHLTAGKFLAIEREGVLNSAVNDMLCRYSLALRDVQFSA